MGAVLTAGHWLRTLRLARGWTQLEAAKRAGISMQAVSRLEKGDIAKPPMEDLCLFGGVLDVTPNQIAEQFGYWRDYGHPEREEDPRIGRLRSVLERLPSDRRSQVYGVLDYAYQMALAGSKAATPTAK